MTNKTRRTRITIEEHEVRIIRRSGKRVTAFCDQCGSMVTAIVAEQVSPIEIPEDQDREIHFIETTVNEPPLICDGSPEN